MSDLSHPYQSLTQDKIIDLVESLGFYSDGRTFPLNSYENRVYQVGIEESTPVIIKVYRPNRWTRTQIQEEHDFQWELANADINVVPPLLIDGKTLHEKDDFLFCLYERRSGRPLELDQLDQLYEVGTQLGRIHSIAKAKQFNSRPELNVETFGQQSIEIVQQSGLLPNYLIEPYQVLTGQLLDIMRQCWSAHAPNQIRLQGDFHPGNILIRDEESLFVDFDDCRNGPAIQDIWMLLSGDRHQQETQLCEIREGYEMFCEFPTEQMGLIETMRTLRQLHYAAWLTSRWDDPAFPHNFPWFGQERYWSEHILSLKEQLAALQEPPLKLL
ncbi:serine/threonine protein kinase [Litoribrevibacter albus]|uniref:serine/threonine protein kinase n=1 Tax=Litoribrevibacter albus TaxID=1473156 RepID=UPI0024E073B1|nr:serine/threonine protein kinase [Litoribrevibacter albus]